MTQQQVLRLSTRFVSAWFLFKAIVSLFSAFEAVVQFSTGIFSALDGVMPGKWERYTYARAATDPIWFCLYVAIAIIFYRCGPRLTRFLVGPKEEQPVVDGAEGTA